MKIIGGLMQILGANDEDVIVLNEAPLALQYRVLGDGRLLYCRDRQAMIEHQAGTVSYYLDFKLFLDQHFQHGRVDFQPFAAYVGEYLKASASAG